jgi:hypothetical protein
MKKLMALTALVISLGSFAKTSIVTTENGADSRSSATITVTGKEAKKLVRYLTEVSQYSGSYVAQDAGMGKFYISAPGISCRVLNVGHLEPEQQDEDRVYSCKVSFGETGAINLN